MKLTNFTGALMQKKEEKEYFAILDQYVDHIFYVNDEAMLKNVRRLNMMNLQQKNIDDLYTDFFMQFHMQDNEWLANYFHMRLTFFKSSIADHSLDMPFEVIQKYVATSKLFKAKRDQYEQAITKAYIIARKEDKEVFNAPAKKLEAERETVFYNHFFRDGVINSMNLLGLDQKNVEASLEHNRNLWLLSTRLQAFKKIVENENITKLKDNKNITPKDIYLMWKLEETNEEMFTVWNALCDSDYYHENKKVIDRLGVATPEMQIKSGKKRELNHQMFVLTSLRKKIVNALLNPDDDILKINK